MLFVVTASCVPLTPLAAAKTLEPQFFADSPEKALEMFQEWLPKVGYQLAPDAVPVVEELVIPISDAPEVPKRRSRAVAEPEAKSGETSEKG